MVYASIELGRGDSPPISLCFMWHDYYTISAGGSDHRVIYGNPWRLICASCIRGNRTWKRGWKTNWTELFECEYYEMPRPLSIFLQTYYPRLYIIYSNPIRCSHSSSHLSLQAFAFDGTHLDRNLYIIL